MLVIQRKDNFSVSPHGIDLLLQNQVIQGLFHLVFQFGITKHLIGIKEAVKINVEKLGNESGL